MIIEETKRCGFRYFMSANMRSLNITLSPDMAALVDRKMASGQFASESDVVRAGLEALAQRDDAAEGWLREDVAPAYDRYVSGKTRSHSLQDVADRLEKRIRSSGDLDQP